MKRLFTLATLLTFATLSSPQISRSQDATSIPRPNIGWSPGAVCADDFALTFVNGQLRCVDSVARAGQADSATIATTAGTAQQLDPNAVVSANQISGQISATQMQTPTCPSGQVLTNTGSGLTCTAVSGGGGTTVACAARTVNGWAAHPGNGSYLGGPLSGTPFMVPAGNNGQTISWTFSYSHYEPYTNSWTCSNGAWQMAASSTGHQFGNDGGSVSYRFEMQ